MLPSGSKKMPVPPRNPRRAASNNNNLLSVEFVLDQNREPKKYEEMNPFADEITNSRPACSDDLSRKRSEEIPITRVDNIIARHGGKTASIDRLPEQLKITKGRQPTEREELLDLKREIGRLRAQIAYYEEIRRVLMELYSKCVEMYKTSSEMMEKQHEAVQTSSRGLAKAEREFLRFWGITVDPAEEDSRWSDGLNEKANYI